MSIKSILRQKKGIFKSNKYSITAEHELEIQDKTLFMSRSGKIPLWIINPNYTTFKKLDTKALLGCLLGSIPGIFAVLSIIYEAPQEKVNFVLIGIASFVFSLLCLSRFIKNLAEGVFFSNKENGHHIFTLYKSSKNKAEVEEFIEILIQTIKSFRYPSSLPIQQKNEIFQRHLDFLFSEGVLNESEIATVINRINEQNQKKAEILKIV